MGKIKAPPPEWKCGIRISQIPKNGEPRVERFTLPMVGAVEHWGQAYTFSGPVSAKAEASFAGGAREKILLKIDVGAEISLPCSRCLCETGLAIVGSLRYLFTLRSSSEGKPDDAGDEDRDGEIDVIIVDAFEAELDLTPWVWEVLILSLPEGVLCSENCRGLCPVCGKKRSDGDCGCIEDGADPRLAALSEFKID